MSDDLDDLDKISELKLLESLDLGHRKVFKEEDKQKENDEFVTDINLLLSKINERIEIIKNIPKLEIKYFDLESTNSDKEKEKEKEKEKNQVPSSANLLTNQNNKLSNISNTNNKMNQTDRNATPYPIEDSTNNNINNNKNKKFIIPTYSINEKTNTNQNKLNNNNNNIDKKEILENQNIQEESIKEDILSLSDLDNNKNNKNEKENEKGNLEVNISEPNLNNKEEDINSLELLKGKKEETKNNNDDDINEPEIELNNKNIVDIISNPGDDIPEIEIGNNNINNSINNNNNKQTSKNKETYESMNYINSNVKNEEENNPNNDNKKIDEIEKENEKEKENDDKNNNFEIEEVEIFEQDKSREKENEGIQKLKNKNNNNNIEDKQRDESERSIEEEREEKESKEENKEQRTNKKSEAEDKKESEEGQDQYDREYDKIKNQFDDINKIPLVTSLKKEEESKINSNRENNNDDNSKEKENKKEENKNTLKDLIIKKEEPSVEIEETSNKNEEEKKEEVLEIKDNDEEISEQEIENNKLKSPKKEPEKTIEEKSKITNKNTDNSNINNQSKKTNTLNKTNTMPQMNLNSSPKKIVFKKSLTQKGDILIQIRPNYLKTDKSETSFNISNIDEYPVLKKLNCEEMALNDIIPDFNEKILKNEKKDIIATKKNYLIKKRQLPLNIKEGQIYSDYFGNLEQTHTQLMVSNYQEDVLKSRIKRDSLFEDKFNNLSFDEINSPIGPVDSFESLCQKYLLEKEDAKNFLENNCLKWRKILGDGNSLYRIIMFSLFEAYILNKKIQELKYLIFEITSDEYVNIYQEKEIDTEICFKIFAEILHLLEEENGENFMKAYEILVKAFSLKDGSFDKMLVVYLRRLLSISIEEVKGILSDEDKDNIIETNNFNSYFIESTNIEPIFFHLCCFQYLFDIKMYIIYLQGEISNPEYTKISLAPEENVDYPSIDIGFFYSSYHKLYPIEFENNYNCTLPLPKTINKVLTIILKDTRFCEECKSETDHFLFIEKKFIICKFCLEKLLSKIFNFRSDYFEKDGFLGIEYYTRPINLEGQYYIDDYEIIELLEGNMLETLIQKYAGVICKGCQEKVDDIIELKCGCEFCKKCLQAKVLKMTKGFRYLNEFEKKEIKNAKCVCGKNFDIDTGLKVVSKTAKDKKEAMNRLKKYIQSCCLICSGELREEMKNGELKDIKDIGYKKIKMKKSNGISLEAEVYETDHLICEECYGKFLKRKIEIDEDDDDNEEEERIFKNDVVDFEKESILCNICRKKHLFKVTQNEACCNSDCMIY